MFSSRLRNLRSEMKLTQKELAEKLNMQNTAISKYELGEREPDIENLNKIAEFFGCSTDYLLGRTDNRSNEDKAQNDSAVFTRAAHKVGHDGPLTDEEEEKIALAIKIALARNNKQ